MRINASSPVDTSFSGNLSHDGHMLEAGIISPLSPNVYTTQVIELYVSFLLLY